MLYTISTLIANLFIVISFFILSAILLKIKIKSANDIFVRAFYILIFWVSMVFCNKLIYEPYKTIALIALVAIVFGVDYGIAIKKTIIVCTFSMLITLSITFIAAALSEIIEFAISDSVSNSNQVANLAINIPLQIVMLVFLIKVKIFNHNFPFLREKHARIIVVTICIFILCLCIILKLGSSTIYEALYPLIFTAIVAGITLLAFWIWQMVYKDEFINKIEVVREENKELKIDVAEQRKFIHKNQSVWSSATRYFRGTKNRLEFADVNVEEIYRIWDEKAAEIYEESPLLQEYINQGILVVSEPVAFYEENKEKAWDLTDYKIFNEQLKNHYKSARKKNIEFTSEIESNAVKYLIESGFITQIALQRLVGDLFKNALEATTSKSEDGNILLKIFAKENGVHKIVFYDCGEYFPKNILGNIGRRGNTTKGYAHGNGLADVFEILAKCKASIVIDESKFIIDGISYAKGIFVRFDMENSVKIV